MKRLLIPFFILTSLTMLAQKQSTFIYELTLFESYKHRAMWTDRQREIQQEHVSYLDSLEEQGALIIRRNHGPKPGRAHRICHFDYGVVSGGF